MEYNISSKLNELQKYIPFINYLIKLDKNKYKKFINIKQWIQTRRRYPLHSLEQIEKSILHQHNLLGKNDIKQYNSIIQESDNNTIKNNYIDLCSEDESNKDENEDDVILMSCTIDENKNEIEETRVENSGIPSKQLVSTSCNISAPVDINLSSEDEIFEECDTVKCTTFTKPESRLRFETNYESEIVNGKNIESTSEINKQTSTNIHENSKNNNHFNILNIDSNSLESMTIEELSELFLNLSKNHSFQIEECLKALFANINPSSENSSASLYSQDAINPNNTPRNALLQDDHTSLAKILDSAINTKYVEKEQRSLEYFEKHAPKNISIPSTHMTRFTYTEKIPVTCPTNEIDYTPSVSHRLNAQCQSGNIQSISQHPSKYLDISVTKNYSSLQRLNLNDPRIIKQLQKIQNSSFHLCRDQQADENVTNLNNIPSFSNIQSTSTYEINEVPKTYGEHKRLKNLKAAQHKRQQLVMDNVLIKNKPSIKNTANQNFEATKNIVENYCETESDYNKKLLNALRPFGDAISAVLQQQSFLQKESLQKNNLSKETFLSNKKHNQEIYKVPRQLNDIECTVNDFKKANNKRRPSMSARTAVFEQMSSEITESVKLVEPATIAQKHNQIKNDSLESTDVPRRSSLCTRSDNIEQISPGLLKLEHSLNRTITNSSNIKRRKTTEISEPIQAIDENSLDSDKNNLNFKNFKSNRPLIRKNFKINPILKLHRLTKKEIKQHTGTINETILTDKHSEKSEINPAFLNVELVVSNQNMYTDYAVSSVPLTSKCNVHMKRRNTDKHMTERNTSFCSLCKSKPLDLTNHYIRNHKIESYVSRFSNDELRKLQINTPFATLITTANRRNKYKVICMFCNIELFDTFINFYAHYSSHTGEYAFQCIGCKMLKPYRADIQSHQLHAKLCRNSRIQVLYQYPSDILTVHLHCCVICNFVQLNEANVYKHLRDHHDKRQDDPLCVQKYILAAICDNKDPNAIVGNNMTPRALDEENYNNEVMVRNEAIFDQHFKIQSNDVEHEMSDKESMAFDKLQKKNNDESLLDKYHKKVTNIEPMTVVHFAEPLKKDETINQMQFSRNSKNNQIGYIDIKPDINEISDQQNNFLPIQIQKTHSNNNTPYVQSEDVDTNANIMISNQKVNENIHPFTSTNMHLVLNIPHQHYKLYNHDTKYYGLFKCLAIDCYFSTNISDEMITHLQEHNESECPPVDIMQCAYCKICDLASYTALVEHIAKEHYRSVFQCSTCCYRSCVPGNVLIHSEQLHPNKTNDYVYECCAIHKPDHGESSKLPAIISENIPSIQCSYCPISFFAIKSIEEHLRFAHNIFDINKNTYDRFICVYCYQCEKEMKNLRIHLALMHPDELAFACERVLKENTKVDAATNLELVDVSIEIQPIYIRNIMTISRDESNDKISGFWIDKNESLSENNLNVFTNTKVVTESKPSLDELIQLNIEILKPLLLKLTDDTGMPPDRLYQCPVESCGGLFSTYELWRSHMSQRHNTLIVPCLHCSYTKYTELSLSDFKNHFEQHCRHLYVCFYCIETFVNELQLHAHLNLAHTEISSEVRLEKIPFNSHYSYYVLLNANLHTNQLEFLISFQNAVKLRLIQLENVNNQKYYTQWAIDQGSSLVEDFPVYNRKQTFKKCPIYLCKYQSNENEIFDHWRESHKINRCHFQCFYCGYIIKGCHSWEPIIEHIQMHNENLFVCGVCSYYHYDRQNISLHIRNMHDARDVPLFHLIRTEGPLTYIRIAIVFAKDNITFTTLSKCFCCSKIESSVGDLLLHLKNIHRFRLSYVCELCNEALVQLQDCTEHYKSKHVNQGNGLKLRCELAIKNKLSINTIMPLSLKLAKITHQSTIITKEQNEQMILDKTYIKQEKCDMGIDADEVNALDQDDLFIVDSLKGFKNQNSTSSILKQQITQKVQTIKCKNIQNLVNVDIQYRN